jgi:hypothetical protein
VTVVGQAFLRQPEAIIYKPGELGRALTSCVQAASVAFAQAANSKTGGTDANETR